MTERKLATIRTISEIKQHTNADALELAIIDGWQCVVKNGEFVQGQFVVYFEIDSWIPTEIAPFLSKGKEPREYEGVKGERLRSIKLRGELSQGLVLPLTVLTVFSQQEWLDPQEYVGHDVSEILNIKKWERPMNPQLQGMARGNFPSFIRKTDQERIQNQFKRMEQQHFDDEYEVTLKVDGSSCTFFYNNGEVGVCSRNLELKLEGNEENAFVKKFNELGLREKLTALGRNIAVQGELWGSGINGNHECVSDIRYSVFDVFNIDTQSYVTPEERYEIVEQLGLNHVPIIQHYTDLHNFTEVKSFLDYAERPSIHNKVAEGVVFKSLTNPDYSFKAISNTFLLGGGE